MSGQVYLTRANARLEKPAVPVVDDYVITIVAIGVLN